MLIARASGKTYIDKIRAVMPQLEGAYSLVLLTPTEVIGIRDPHGVRPLTIGRLHDHWMIASETCAIETVGGESIRDVEPGEVIVLSGDGPEGMQAFEGQASEGMAACLFEYIYFARPDSTINDRSLYLARQRMGEQLAQEYPVAADFVIPVPDSASPAAAGYAAARKHALRRWPHQESLHRPDVHPAGPESASAWREDEVQCARRGTQRQTRGGDRR